MALTIKDLPIGAKVDIGLFVDGYSAIFEKLADNHYGKNEATLYPTHILNRKAFDAKEPKNENENRQKYGNNNIRLSNLMQWLNSDKKDWYEDQHDADQAPTSEYVSQRPYADEPGFLTYLQPQVRQHLIAVTRTAIEPSTDGGGTKNYEAKAFPLSRTEIGLGNEREADGKPFPQFDSDESRIATRIGTTTKDFYWLSTPYASFALSVRFVNSDGTLNLYNAYGGNYGVRPALTFSSDTPIVEVEGGYEVPYNKPPTITLAEVSGRTLHEGDTLNLKGEAMDFDAGDVVSVKAQINNGAPQTLAAALTDGSLSVAYDKKWTYRQGAFYTEENYKIIEGLKENTTHRLRVWAEDDKGNKSTEEVRTFFVVLNRPPKVTIDPLKIADLISTDTVELTGTVSDPDGNTIDLDVKINGGTAFSLKDLESGDKWSISVPVQDFAEGSNKIEAVATDSYGAVTRLFFPAALNFKAIENDNFVVRYDLNPKKIEMQGLIAWIERTKGSTATAAVSLVGQGEKEKYEDMERSNTVDVDLLTEDEFDYLSSSGGGTEVTLRVSVKDGFVAKISGAFQQKGDS